MTAVATEGIKNLNCMETPRISCIFANPDAVADSSGKTKTSPPQASSVENGEVEHDSDDDKDEDGGDTLVDGGEIQIKYAPVMRI
jgi:hypothetical protein